MDVGSNEGLLCDNIASIYKCPWRRQANPNSHLQDICFAMERENKVVDGKKLLRYSMQLSMLKQLFLKGLIDENEYQIIKKKLMKDYGIVSDITA